MKDAKDKLAWFPLYIADFIVGTAAMSAAARGCYIMLLCHIWDSGPLPNDLKALDRIAPGTRRVWTEIADKFRVVDGRLVNDRLEEVRAQQQKAHANAVVRASKGAVAMHKKRASSSAPSMLQALHQACSEQPSSTACEVLSKRKELDPSPPSGGRGVGEGESQQADRLAEPASFAAGRAAMLRRYPPAEAEAEFEACVRKRTEIATRRLAAFGMDQAQIATAIDALHAGPWETFTERLDDATKGLDGAISKPAVVLSRLGLRRLAS